MVFVAAFACHSPEPPPAEYPQIELDPPQQGGGEHPEGTPQGKQPDAGAVPSDAGAARR